MIAIVLSLAALPVVNQGEFYSIVRTEANGVTSWENRIQDRGGEPMVAERVRSPLEGMRHRLRIAYEGPWIREIIDVDVHQRWRLHAHYNCRGDLVSYVEQRYRESGCPSQLNGYLEDGSHTLRVRFQCDRRGRVTERRIQAAHGETIIETRRYNGPGRLTSVERLNEATGSRIMHRWAQRDGFAEITTRQSEVVTQILRVERDTISRLPTRIQVLWPDATPSESFLTLSAEQGYAIQEMSIGGSLAMRLGVHRWLPDWDSTARLAGVTTISLSGDQTRRTFELPDQPCEPARHRQTQLLDLVLSYVNIPGLEDTLPLHLRSRHAGY